MNTSRRMNMSECMTIIEKNIQMIILHTEDFKVTAGHAKAFDKSLLIKQN
jgi:hypothetical protein